MEKQKSLFKDGEEYCPEGPYHFITGKYPGRSAEVLMFRNYGYLLFVLQKIKENWTGGKKNRLHLHLEWLLKRGEEIVHKTKLVCPYCKEDKPATHFSVLRSYYRSYSGISIGTNYTCCGSKKCKEKINAQAFGKIPSFYDFRFSNIKRVAYYKKEEERLGELYQAAYGLGDEKLSAKKVFNLFKKQEQS